MITYTVDLAELDAEAFSLGDVIDICEAVDCAPEDLKPLLADEHAGTRRLRAMAAIAWVLHRRTETALTLEKVLAGRVNVIGAPRATVGPQRPADATTPGVSGPG